MSGGADPDAVVYAGIGFDAALDLVEAAGLDPRRTWVEPRSLVSLLFLHPADAVLLALALGRRLRWRDLTSDDGTVTATEVLVPVELRAAAERAVAEACPGRYAVVEFVRLAFGNAGDRALFEHAAEPGVGPIG